jgi:hypothetical protein
VLFEGVLGCRIKVSSEGQTRVDWGLFWGFLNGFLVVELRFQVKDKLGQIWGCFETIKWVFGCRIKFWVKKRLGQILGCLSGFWVVKFRFWMKERLGQIWGYLRMFWVVEFRFWVKTILRLFWSRVPSPL